MKTTPQSLLVGLVAGSASAFLVLGPGNPSLLSVLLSVFATLPVLIAGLGWSNVAGGIAVLSGAVVIAVVQSPLEGALVAATTLLPAAWIAHLSNLARPAEELGGPQGQMAWYPLSDIMLHLCGLVAVSLIMAGSVIGYGADIIGGPVDALFAMMQQQNPEIQLDSADRTAVIAYFTRLLPIIAAATQVMILFCSWYIASAVVRISGRARRPADVIPVGLRMSRLSMLVLGAGLLLCLASGPLGLVGSTVTGAFAGGFILAGLALVHHRTSGSPWRPLVLWTTYLAFLPFIPLPQLIFFFVGLLETARTSPLSSTGSNDNQPQ